MRVTTKRSLMRLAVGFAIFGTFALPAGTAHAAPLVWRLVSTNISDTSPGLVGVSCTRPSQCVGVGSQQAPGSGSLSQTLVEVWDGKSWSIVPSPDEGPNDANVLQSVSCSSRRSCVAVGYWCSSGCLENQSLVEVFDGSVWAVVPSPDPGSRNQLNSVSCTSARSCTAVGGYCPEAGCPDGSYFKTLIETWNGTAVSLASSPNPTTEDNILSSVSCVSAANCQAVGGGASGGDFETLVESWNGTIWSATPSPNPGTDSVLLGISCVNANHCEAVGWMDAGLDVTPQRTLVESWNGSGWSVVSSVSPGTGSDLLNSVSCISARRCVAVGVYATGSVTPPPMQIWNGIRWSEISGNVPNPNGGYDGLLCMSHSRCVVLDGDQTLIGSRR